MLTIELEKIGGSKPWIARITGRDEKYGLAREFVDGVADYSRSNRPGTRGVYYSFDLGTGYYEVKGGTSWGSCDNRKFIHVRDDDQDDAADPWWYEQVTMQDVLDAIRSGEVVQS